MKMDGTFLEDSVPVPSVFSTIFVPFLLLFHTCRRQETYILSPEGLHMSNSAVYYLNKILSATV
jgi:hypothetical protein